MPSRNIEDLHPDLQPICRELLRRCQAANIDILLTCTYRSNDEQNQLYALGRTKPGRIVTKAKAGQSAHNNTIQGRPASRAFDVVPLRNGKLIWGTSGNGLDNDPADDLTDDLELWQRVGQIGMELGLNWYGKPTAKFREFPHFELAKGYL